MYKMKEHYGFFWFLEKLFQTSNKVYLNVQRATSLNVTETENNRFKVISSVCLPPTTIEITSCCRAVPHKLVSNEVCQCSNGRLNNHVIE